jgi:uncharacterized protein (TIGR03083 family)
MRLPLDDEVVLERTALVATLEAMSARDFESGPTLCAGWAPRDVLAHVMGVENLTTFARHALRINAANEAMVRAGRRLSRPALLKAARAWAEEPSLTSRVLAWGLLGDLAIHHQDILRGAGQTRTLRPAVAHALFREGVIWSWPFGQKLLHHRVVPDDGLVRPLGRGREVHGTTEALAMWLGGRQSVARELTFAS